jgi:hypothetical protein
MIASREAFIFAAGTLAAGGFAETAAALRTGEAPALPTETAALTAPNVATAEM